MMITLNDRDINKSALCTRFIEKYTNAEHDHAYILCIIYIHYIDSRITEYLVGGYALARCDRATTTTTR